MYNFKVVALTIRIPQIVKYNFVYKLIFLKRTIGVGPQSAEPQQDTSVKISFFLGSC